MNEGDAIITLTGKIFKAASEDGVYFWKRGDEWLYVGATGNLIGRLAYHNIIGRVEPVLEDDVIGLIPTEPFSSISLESRLVEQHRPKYNPFALLLALVTALQHVLHVVQRFHRKGATKYIAQTCVVRAEGGLLLSHRR